MERKVRKASTHSLTTSSTGILYIGRYGRVNEKLKKNVEKNLKIFSCVKDKISHFGKKCDFSRKGRVISFVYIVRSCALNLPRKLRSDTKSRSLFAPFGDWQAEFGEDFFHILPDLSAVLL